MKKSDDKKRKVLKLVITSALLSIMTVQGVKLVKGRTEAYRILDEHNNSNSNHQEHIVAHRGFSGLEPDNSYESVLLALESDCVDMIEIDVRKTMDNQIIIHHDTTINFNDSLFSIEEINLDEIDEKTLIRRYPFFDIEGYLYNDFIFQFERFLEKDAEDKEVIRFDNFIKWYSFEKPLIVDVKVGDISFDYMIKLNNILKDKKDKVFIQSENYEFISKMMELFPDYRYFYIINSVDDLSNMNSQFAGYTVRSNLLSKVQIDQDKMYLIYTINSSKKYVKLLSNKKYNEDMYIITDNPDYICALSDQKKKRMRSI